MTVSVFIENTQETVEVEVGTRLYKVAQEVANDGGCHHVLAIVDGKLKELHKKVKQSCKVRFLDKSHRDGYRTYQRSLTLLFVRSLRSVYEAYGVEDVDVRVHFTINAGLYCECLNTGDKPLDTGMIHLIEERMHQYVHQNARIKKRTVTTSKAIEIFEEQKLWDKVQLLKYRSASNTNIYELDGYYDYFYGYMVPYTGCLDTFSLMAYKEGVMIQYPYRHAPEVVSDFNPDHKLFETQMEAYEWAKRMDMTTIAALNEGIANGDMNDMILVAEALMEKKIATIADAIIHKDNPRRFVFIAGPSSSGKTTFAHRLGIQLKALGMKPTIISLDNYFVNRENTPRDEDGNYDFETIEAIDIDAFNRDMLDLLAGNAVDIPVFNFISGEREYRNNPLEMGDKGILIVEGIHGLNERLSAEIPSEHKFKIYISAMTQLNLDHHNRIPTTDGRLIRRIVRDHQYRGASASKTIRMWPSVRRGEEKYIFPYQEEADVMFNSALIYEFAVLKQYVDPLLYNISPDSPEYMEAKRLLKFMDYILGITSEHIPQNSLIREFVGGSCFRT